MIGYVILKLILNAATGMPLEVGPVEPVVTYATYEECEHAKSAIGPQKVKDGKVVVYSCATPKQVTVL